MLSETILDKLETLPTQPGVYLFRDKKGVIVYVGKAKSLRSRVRSYFHAGGSDTRAFIAELDRTLGDIDTVVTQNEKEAAILENALIKEQLPRFNVKLRDDKEFLLLRIGTDHPWPRLTVVRRSAEDGARYFGPYPSATAARRALHLINKHFQLRTCSDVELDARQRPCLQYQIKRCPAPCVYDVDHGFYAEQVRAVALFLDGRHDELTAELTEKMSLASQALSFELAAVHRDQLRAIEGVREEQRIVSVDGADRDALGLFRDGALVEIARLRVRAGRLADVSTFSLGPTELPDEEIVAAFVGQHYGRGLASSGDERAPASSPPARAIPREIVLPLEPEGTRGIAEWLTERAGHKVSLLVPKRGVRAELLALASENAAHAFAEKRRAEGSVEARLADLRERLRLPTLPRRIECCDISHLGGEDTVGAVVALRDGELDRGRYRTFHVRGAGGGVAAGDDYAAMYEVLARRFRRGVRARANRAEGVEAAGAEWELPDLFVVDGGRGQLGVALAAAHDLGLHDLTLVGLAKERETVAGEALVDRVYLPGQKNPIPLRNAPALLLLARLRDEAHRVSNRARERIGKARRLRSVFDDVPGLGPVAKKALLSRFSSRDAVQRASDEELLAAPGITRRHIRALRVAFGEAHEGEVPTTGTNDNSVDT